MGLIPRRSGVGDKNSIPVYFYHHSIPLNHHFINFISINPMKGLVGPFFSM
jgi:hypothetical protein